MRQLLSGRPLRTKLLIYFLPILILSVGLTGSFSYWLSVNLLKKNAYSLLDDTIHQTDIFLNDKFTTVLSQIVAIQDSSAFNNLAAQAPGSNSKSYNDVIAINSSFNRLYSNYFQIIDSAYLKFNNGYEFNLLKDSVPRHIGVNLESWMSRYKTSVNGYFWLNTHTDEVFDTINPRKVMSVFEIFGNQNSTVKGLLLLNLRTSYFLNILQNVNVSPHGYLALISPDGVLYSKDIDRENAIGRAGIAFLANNSGNYGSFNIKSAGGKKLFVVFNTLSANNWVLAAIVPESDIMQKEGQIKYISLAVIGLVLVLSAIAAALFAGNLSNSIRHLSRQVRRFEQGDTNVHFNIKDQNEIGILARGLSSLMNTVTSLLTQLREEQEKKREMELLALQSQITPHFLYNTLTSIKHLIDLKDNEKASKMVGALTKYFRIGISRGRELITVKEELAHIENYLFIQKMRYSKEFDFEFNVNPEVYDCNIIKLTLQPLIENSIYHGIKNIHERGLIRVSGWREGGVAVIEVYDNGPGIEPGMLAELQQMIASDLIEENPITFGMRNVHQRTMLHFGKLYGISIESVKDEYTKVILRIPFSVNREAYPDV